MYVCAQCPQRSKEGTGFPRHELQMVVNYHVGAGNQPYYYHFLPHSLSSLSLFLFIINMYTYILTSSVCQG